MRVITGTARGRKLKTLEGMDVRPTTDMVKEAVFSIVQFQVPCASVLDVFAGSGQMGIEALSRGAARAVFVDNSRASQAVIRENLAATGLAKQARVIADDAVSFLAHRRPLRHHFPGPALRRRVCSAGAAASGKGAGAGRNRPVRAPLEGRAPGGSGRPCPEKKLPLRQNCGDDLYSCGGRSVAPPERKHFHENRSLSGEF